MTLLAPPRSNDAEVARADALLTSERDELKYLVAEAMVPELARALDRALSRHRFAGAGANGLPNPHHYVTTIYFDTPSRAHHRAAVAGGPFDVKVRAKEYYDLHPTLAELATDPAHIVRYQPWLWLELKRREGTRTCKRRFRVSKRDVPALFTGGHVSPESLEAFDDASASPDDVREIAAHCRALGEPLAADCLVNYRRLPWQDAAGVLRVTMDLDVAAFAPPSDLWTRTRALVRPTLGPPRPLVREAIVEVKSRGPLPGWLEAALSAAGAVPGAWSKFTHAAEAIRA